MKHSRFRFSSMLATSILFTVGSFLPGTALVSASSPPADSYAIGSRQPIHPIPLYKDAAPAARGIPPCLHRLVPPHCYSPLQIRQAYQIQPLIDAGIAGQGQTIVIIDFIQNPNLRHDLHIFDQLFGLPDPVLNIFAPQGLTPLDILKSSDVLDAEEINLDVEWAHAIAPAATIDLVLSKSEHPEDTYEATRFAVEQNLGSVISQSFGFTETALSDQFIAKEHALFELARSKGISVFAAAGDTGTLEPIYAGDPKTIVALGPGIVYPASDPLVTSVGGTTLTIGPGGTYESERVWSNSRGSTGGGFSRLFDRPDYQDGIDAPSRGIPDVAYNADPETGVPTVISILADRTLIVPFGGTSAGTPQWAALTVLGNQLAGRRLGFLNPELYAIGRSAAFLKTFHDITVGTNAFTFKFQGERLPIPGYTASPGWDPTTGLGSPKTLPLLIHIIQQTSTGGGIYMLFPVQPKHPHVPKNYRTIQQTLPRPLRKRQRIVHPQHYANKQMCQHKQSTHGSCLQHHRPNRHCHQ